MDLEPLRSYLVGIEEQDACRRCMLQPGLSTELPRGIYGYNAGKGWLRR